MDHNFNHTVNILHMEDAGDLHFTKACKIQVVFFSVPRDLCKEDGVFTDVYDSAALYIVQRTSWNCLPSLLVECELCVFKAVGLPDVEL